MGAMIHTIVNTKENIQTTFFDKYRILYLVHCDDYTVCLDYVGSDSIDQLLRSLENTAGKIYDSTYQTLDYYIDSEGEVLIKHPLTSQEVFQLALKDLEKPIEHPLSFFKQENTKEFFI